MEPVPLVISAVVSAAATLVLALVAGKTFRETAKYAEATTEMARETRHLAEETRRLVDEARGSRKLASLPALEPVRYESASPQPIESAKEIGVHLRNNTDAPALDVYRFDMWADVPPAPEDAPRWLGPWEILPGHSLSPVVGGKHAQIVIVAYRDLANQFHCQCWERRGNDWVPAGIPEDIDIPRPPGWPEGADFPSATRAETGT